MENNLINTYSSVFLKNKSLFTENMPKEIANFREQALNDFNLLGIPTKKLEKYKYIDLEPLFNQKYDFYLTPKLVSLNIEDIFKCDVPQLDMKGIIALNGFYYQKNLFNGWQSNGSYIGSLRQAIIDIPDIISKYLNKTYTSDDGLLSLNSLLFQDGFFIYIPANKTINFPLQLINILFAENNLFSVQRNLIVLEENASATLVLCDHTLSPMQFLHNNSTEIILGENAQLNFTNLQNVSNQTAFVNTINVEQKAHSNMKSTILSLHGGVIRNNVNVKLNGEYAESHINGLYITDGKQYIDNDVFVMHNAPLCTSNQLFKGILDNNSSAAFTGRIFVSRNAQKTNAYQKCNNLILTPEAKVYARPQLEIYADDVKCSHGATSGHVNEEEMFYLRTRGISQKEAQFLLMFAFAYEITQNIPLKDLRFRLEEMINKRLRKELGRCHNCQITVY
jgi:Fe-S cluster assembly protein SufD